MSISPTTAFPPVIHPSATGWPPQTRSTGESTPSSPTSTEDDWHRPTDCTEWNVREMVAHLVGAAEATARVREFVRLSWLGLRVRPGGPLVDGINRVQIRERATATPDELRRDLVDAAVRGVRARHRLPGPVRAVRMPMGPPVGFRPIGYLMDCIFTRDAWMHRVDIARATGRPLSLTAEHDGRIVADVVAEWARRTGSPFRLTLTGPAGGLVAPGRTARNRPSTRSSSAGSCPAARRPGLLAQEVPF